ncbi:MAG: Chromosome-partitioning ATPase Soj [Anaerolineales bacterium]|nr:Chromosome-partitioning ATPase Soj [Anaerolineales bacterium]
MKTVVFANQKGGTGKTTTVISVGDIFARLGKRVLIVDLDPQGHAAVSMNMDAEPCVANWLMYPLFNNHLISPEIMNSWIRPTRQENLFLLPGNQMTAKAQRMLTIEETPINYINDYLFPIRKLGFNYLLFDTPPSTGGLQEMASWAADLAVIVSSLDYLSADGVWGFLEMLKILQTEKQWRGKLAGILPTFYDEQTRTTREQMTNLQRAFPDQVFAPIHRATLVREASAEGLTIFQKDPTSRPALEYEKFAMRLAKLD